MKEKILAFLKTNSKLVRVPDSYLLGVAETWSKTIKEEKDIETVFTDGVIDTIKYSADQLQIEGDKRIAQAKFDLKAWQDKHGLDENGKLIDDPIKRGPGRPKKEVDPDPDEPAWFTAFKKEQADSVAALKSEIEAQKQEKTLAALSERVKAHDKLKDVPPWYLKKCNLVPESEDKIEQLVAGIKIDWDEAKQFEAERGVVISVPPAGGGPAGDKVTIQDYLDEKFPKVESKN
jgi:hypothetical protein